MPIDIKELIVRATVDNNKSCENEADILDKSKNHPGPVNNLQRQIEQLQRMINQKNER